MSALVACAVLAAGASRRLGPVASHYARKIALPALFPRALFGALARIQGESGATELLSDGRRLWRVSWPDGEFDFDLVKGNRGFAP
jgi:CTP:molybdopterin cytidylyltransferase MocA